MRRSHEEEVGGDEVAEMSGTAWNAVCDLGAEAPVLESVCQGAGGGQHGAVVVGDRSGVGAAMRYASTSEGRAEALPGLVGTCPACGSICRPKCGQMVIWHWAHHARADCDRWSEPMTEWHRAWQEVVPDDRREVVMGPHRADIVTASGGVVELQHSPISPEIIADAKLSTATGWRGSST
jgi:Competence protein CoiA-like family